MPDPATRAILRLQEDIDCLVIERDEARAEVERLRAALEKIWDHPTDLACDGECAQRMNAIAGAALRPITGITESGAEACAPGVCERERGHEGPCTWSPGRPIRGVTSTDG